MDEELHMEEINKKLSESGLRLEMREGRLCLTDGTLTLAGDFGRMAPRVKKSNLERELLVRAAKVRGIQPAETIAADATAGLGEDSLLLAAAGFHVTMYERDPVIAMLLRDAMRRARDIPELQEAVSRMRLREEDSTAAFEKWQKRPEALVVYLDPMFPERTKSSLVKKKFQLLHRLESPCGDERMLLEAAFGARPDKIVVKRPVRGAYLGERKPSYSLTGKTIRYDCYVLPRDS